MIDSQRASRPQRATELAVRLDDVWKSYGRGAAQTAVLQGVDLTIGRGQCAFLVGPSGCGKSTLLSIIGCILTPDRGSTYVLGQRVDMLGAEALTRLRRSRLGFVFQRFHLVRGLSALENVAVPLTLAGVSAARSRRRAGELLEAVGLSDQQDSHAHHLSAGQCQRVAIARALAADPELILADEPTASLDAETGQQIMTLLKRLTWDEQKSMVVVTHDPRILHHADRVYRLDDGRLTEQPGTSALLPAATIPLAP